MRKRRRRNRRRKRKRRRKRRRKKERKRGRKKRKGRTGAKGGGGGTKRPGVSKRGANFSEMFGLVLLGGALFGGAHQSLYSSIAMMWFEPLYFYLRRGDIACTPTSSISLALRKHLLDHHLPEGDAHLQGFSLPLPVANGTPEGSENKTGQAGLPRGLSPRHRQSRPVQTQEKCSLQPAFVIKNNCQRLSLSLKGKAADVLGLCSG